MTIAKILMWVFTAICWWKIFEKANIRGWKAIIPFYSDYVRFGMANKKWWYIPFLLLSTIEMVVSFVYSALKAVELADTLIEDIDIIGDLSTLFWTRNVLSILVFAISVHVGIVIAGKFGKSKVFGAGLGIIPIVFAPIIAFDQSRYNENDEI